MKKTFAALLLLAAVCAAQAQTPAENYAQHITATDLKSVLTVIAGPEMEGRETATEGQRKAAAYIASQFKAAGLQPAPGTTNYQQTFTLFYDTLINTRMVVNGKEYVFGTDYLANLTTTKSASIKSKQVVFGGYGIQDSLYNDYEGKNVKGKIVVVFSGEPKSGDKYLLTGSARPSAAWSGYQAAAAKSRVAKSLGAKALVIIVPGTAVLTAQTPLALRKSNIYYPRPADKTTVQTVTVSHTLAAALLDSQVFEGLLAKAKKMESFATEKLAARKKVKFDFSKKQVPQYSTNVAGFIEGTDKKDEYIVITGHYDHLGKRGEVIYYGADDDGSGTTGVIELARAFGKAAANGNRPRRTMVFMTVSGEEKGLLGSQYYSEHPLFPLEKTSVNLNIDMVGRIDPSRGGSDSSNYVYVIGDDKLSTDLATITDNVNKSFVNLTLDRRFNANDPNRFYYRSDHYNFAKKGVPIIFYFNGTHADYHKPTDTVDKINFDLMEKRVKLVYHTAWEMANRDAMLKRDLPLN